MKRHIIALAYHAGLLGLFIPSGGFSWSPPRSGTVFRRSDGLAPFQVFSSSAQHEQGQGQQPQVIVVGKVIVDEYGNPDEEMAPNITVGGGGPQAAIGAALALATRSYLLDEEEGRENSTPTYDQNTNKNRRPLLPPPQPVTMIGPVGDDFSQTEEEALFDILGSALQDPPRYFRGRGLLTPRIRLWHDEKQVLHWYALNDSFGESGAAGLWGRHPSVQDYLDILQGTSNNDNSDNNSIKPVLHVIAEGGVEAPGNNGDSKPLNEKRVRDAISFLGVEPILFPNSDGVVSEEDTTHCSKLLQGIVDATPTDNPSSVVFSPDMAAFQSMEKHSCTPSLSSSGPLDSVAVRDGPRGSQILSQQPQQSATGPKVVPAATLRRLVNPTGAGNAYSGAYTALRGSGCDIIDSAALATGVGAVFCEHSHCPSYNWETIERVADASREVKEQLLQKTNKPVKQ